MGDHPASDPAKPGTKLASMQALGRRGGLRQATEEKTPISATVDTSKRPGRVTREAKPSPVTTKAKIKAKASKTVNAPQQKRVTKTKTKAVKVKTVKRARAVLKKAEKLAAAKAKRPGPPTKVGQPWRDAGVSKTTYYRNLKQGSGNE